MLSYKRRRDIRTIKGVLGPRKSACPQGGPTCKVWGSALVALGGRKFSALPRAELVLSHRKASKASLLPCYLAEIKTAAWNRCLLAGSLEYASFRGLCKPQQAFPWHKLCASPATVAEEVMRQPSGVRLKPLFTHPAISRPLERALPRCRPIPARPWCEFPAHAPSRVAELLTLRL